MDWGKVVTDIRQAGLTFGAMSKETKIPESTIKGYLFANAEPKYADGEQMLALWRRCMWPPVPRLPKQ